NCGCGRHEHHDHDGGCGCGHQEHHDHDEGCGCGHQEHHDHDEGCGCGHQEHHDHDEGCGCGHQEHHDHDGGCGCGHQEHHDHDGGCGCGHGDGCGCGHDHGDAQVSRLDLWLLGGAIALFLISFLPVGNFALPLLLAATLLAGYRLFWDGIRALPRGGLDEMTLMLIAVAAAFAIGEYREAVIVTVLFRIGQYFEALAVSRSRRDIEALTKIRPETANLLVDGEYVSSPAAEIPVGSTILIRAGERVPLDCVVLSGETMLDTSALTGESVPRPAAPGDRVLSGMVNAEGAVTCRTVNAFEDSAASRILQMVQDSAAKKGNAEKMISRFARVYTPAVVAAAVLLAVLPPLLGLGDWGTWISRSLVFLVASCPCALVISIPLSYFAGVGACSKKGVLVKGSKYIELLAKPVNVVLDKTGTLTTGRLKVTKVESLSQLDEKEILRLAAIGESGSSHPMAQAVTASQGGVSLEGVSELKEITGKGVAFSLDGKQYYCGSRRLLEAQGIPLEDLPQANIYLADKSRVLGCILVSDEVRDDAAETIRRLKEAGVQRTVMLTGDSEAAALAIQAQSGVDEIHAGLLPEDKVRYLEEIRRSGVTVFAGDGMNDAPVLSMADVGVAMGLGTDVAIEAADAVLVSDRLGALADGIRLAKRTSSTARFNMVFALGIKAVVLVLGACGLAQMWMAVFADVGVAVLAILNATRLLRTKRNR
ncbi:MAG: heavy metal translocating P-type ATPase, partial [Oscillospiraceae bacterium]|nr:heavy metal translocating P-type ATPase [Oscillospiraceae bacterium]